MVRTLHSNPAGVVGVVGDDDDVDAGEVVDGVVPPVDVVVFARTLVEVEGVAVVDVEARLVGVGATATGVAPTWESASPTICQVSTVVRTSAITHAAAIFQEIMDGLSQPLRHR